MTNPSERKRYARGGIVGLEGMANLHDDYVVLPNAAMKGDMDRRNHIELFNASFALTDDQELEVVVRQYTNGEVRRWIHQRFKGGQDAWTELDSNMAGWLAENLRAACEVEGK